PARLAAAGGGSQRPFTRTVGSARNQARALTGVAGCRRRRRSTRMGRTSKPASQGAKGRKCLLASGGCPPRRAKAGRVDVSGSRWATLPSSKRHTRMLHVLSRIHPGRMRLPASWKPRIIYQGASAFQARVAPCSHGERGNEKTIAGREGVSEGGGFT